MRTFHHLKLIEEISATPYTTIGQRSYSLMSSYLMPYKQFLEVSYSPDLEEEIKNTPSIEDFVASELNEEYIGAVQFDFYLGLIAEDERQLLELTIDYIRKYETVYPLSQKHYHFVCNCPQVDLRNTLLKAMFMRPKIYGFYDLANLRAFLDGYFRMKTEYDIPTSEYEEKLLQLINYWKTLVNPQLPFETWERVFAFEKMGTNSFTNMFTWELERFEDILFEETGMELIPPEVIGGL